MKHGFGKRIGLSALALTLMLPLQSSYVKANSRVDTLLSSMSTKQKISQMLMVDFRKWDEDTTDEVAAQGFTKMNPQVQKIVEDYDFGAVIYFADNIVETAQSYQLSLDMQKAATKDNGIPLLISCDQEGGIVYRLGSGTALPGNMALGATGNPEYAKNAGQIIGSELKAVGINTTLAPVVDVNNNPNNPVIGLRSYSDDATIVGEMASANISGLAEYNVIGCAKHFPGHGDTATDSHYGLPVVNKTKDVLMQNELRPYEVAISQGIEMIMSAHILYPELDNTTVVSDKTGKEEKVPATLSKKILTDLLKGEMGFDGVVCTDAMNMKGIADTFDEVQAVKLAINAGVDLICMPTVLQNLDDLKDLDAIINGVEASVEAGEIKESRLDDACRRILTLKDEKGILDWKETDGSVENAEAIVGSKANRELERVISANSVTLIKNENNVLPLDVKENEHVLMLCPYNNERSQMVMGWNRAKDAGLVPATAEVDVVRFDYKATAETLKDKLDWATTVILNSEISSASKMTYTDWRSRVVNEVVNYAHENNKTSIVMSVDKPYDVQLYDNADAILAVYGCKGSTVDVTDALIGATTSKAAYGPNIIAGIEVALGVFGAQGKLPLNIPRLDAENLVYTEEIVYPRGYGLTYASKLIDKSVLEETIEAYKDVDANAYTPESYAAFKEAYDQAVVVLNDERATQEQIDAACQALTTAYENLVKVEEKPQPEVKPDPEEKPVAPEKPEVKPEIEEDENPGTADHSHMYAFLFTTMLSAAALFVLKGRREEY